MGCVTAEGMDKTISPIGKGTQTHGTHCGTPTTSHNQLKRALSPTALTSAPKRQATRGGIRCRVCRNSQDLREPIVIPCGHLFCYMCLVDSFRDKKRLICPACDLELVSTQHVALD
ncbi:hypothetical protein C8Q76DRAFT_736700 [Earliella scabrosa]|nr:hypothetical protein C8Q76DRAFT_736700 [Earliella scabrosa]